MDQIVQNLLLIEKLQMKHQTKRTNQTTYIENTSATRNVELSLENELQSYMLQNKQLRMKCQKIDQIQTYTTTLLASLQTLQCQNSSLSAQIQSLSTQNISLNKRIQLHSQEFQTTIHKVEKSQKIENQKLRAQIRCNKDVLKVDNESLKLELIKYEQEIGSQREEMRRGVVCLEAGYQGEIERLKNRVRGLEEQLSAQHNSSTKKQQQMNSQLRNQKQQTLTLQTKFQTIKMQRDHLSLELSKANPIISDLQRINTTNQQLMNQYEEKTLEMLTKMKVEMEKMKNQKDKLESQNCLFGKLNGQLKGDYQGLYEKYEDGVGKVIALEQSQGRWRAEADNLKHQLMLTQQSLSQTSEQHTNFKGQTSTLMEVLQRDNLESHSKVAQLTAEVQTKTTEITDLITIINKLEKDIDINQNRNKQAHENCVILEQGNQKLRLKIREIESGKVERGSYEEVLKRREGEFGGRMRMLKDELSRMR